MIDEFVDVDQCWWLSLIVVVFSGRFGRRMEDIYAFLGCWQVRGRGGLGGKDVLMLLPLRGG